MGILIATDIFKARLASLFSQLSFVLVYIDDIAVITKGTLSDHFDKVEKVLKILLDSGIQLNPRKYAWASNQIEYLGYVISKEGIKPQTKNFYSLLNIKEPTNKKQLRRFIGMTIYYKETFSQRAHVMKPLTPLTGKIPNGHGEKINPESLTKGKIERDHDAQFFRFQ